MRHVALLSPSFAALALLLIMSSARADLINDDAVQASVLEQDDEAQLTDSQQDPAVAKNLIYLDGAGWADSTTYLRVYSGFQATDTKTGDLVGAKGDPLDWKVALDTTAWLNAGQSDDLALYQADDKRADFKIMTPEQWKKIAGDGSSGTVNALMTEEPIRRWQRAKPLEADEASEALTVLADSTLDQAVATLSSDSVSADATSVPEPGALSLLAVGLAGILATLAQRRRRQRIGPNR